MDRAEQIFQKLINEGEKAIDEFILTNVSEELFLDFKRSSDDGKGSVISQTDRNNLGKAISGFGNSEGGVIVWGVDCSKSSDRGDVASSKFPLKNAAKFKSLIESVLSGTTLPPHTKVQNHAILRSKNDEGFVISYIPKSLNAPHQAIYNKMFYIRAGSNFEPTPYQVLAGMFGRVPLPYVYNMYMVGPAKIIEQKVMIQVGFMIHNEGPGIASDIFLNVKAMSSSGTKCEISFETPDTKNWAGGFTLGRFMSLISKTDLRLPPGGFLQPLLAIFTFEPPFEEDLDIRVSCGSSNSPAMNGSISNKKETIDETYKKYVKKSHDPNWSKDEMHKLAMGILGSPPNAQK